MPIFFVFVFFLIGVIAGIYSPYFLFLVVVPFVYLLCYRKIGWKSLFYALPLLLGFLIVFFYPRGSLSQTQIEGIVVARKDSYFFLATWHGKYLIYDKEQTIPLFSYVRIRGNAGSFSFSHYEQSFDFVAYLKTQGVFLVFFSKETDLVFNSRFWPQKIFSYPFQNLNATAKPLVLSLLTGSSLVNSENASVINELGLSSLLSLSGFHLSFLMLFLRKLLQKKHPVFLHLFLYVFFGFLLFLSEFRFTLMRLFLALILSDVSQAKLHLVGPDKKALEALIFLVPNPYLLLSPAFYYPFPLLFFLSFLPKEKRKKSRLAFWSILTLFFLPLRLIERKAFSPIGIALQFVLIPYSHLLFLSSFLLFVCPPFGYVLNYLVMGFLKIIAFGDEINIVLVSGIPALWILIIFYLLVLLAVVLKTYHFQKQAKRAVITSLLILSISFIPDFQSHAMVSFIDVDQGDATLVREGQTNFLIDTGGKTTVDLAYECLIPFFRTQKISFLDAVVITHTDYDHSGALESLVKHFKVNQVYYASDFLSQKDQSIAIGSVMVRNYNTYAGNTADNNIRSGVYSFSIHNTSFLIMGDAPKDIERRITADHPNLRTNYLKIGHHGSKTSTSAEFLRIVKPTEAIISCGLKNQYNFPDKATIQVLKDQNVSYRRTDEEGTISIVLP